MAYRLPLQSPAGSRPLTPRFTALTDRTTRGLMVDLFLSPDMLCSHNSRHNNNYNYYYYSYNYNYYYQYCNAAYASWSTSIVVYHTAHLFRGFILLPRGQLYALANSTEFDTEPITLHITNNILNRISALFTTYFSYFHNIRYATW